MWGHYGLAPHQATFVSCKEHYFCHSMFQPSTPRLPKVIPLQEERATRKNIYKKKRLQEKTSTRQLQDTTATRQNSYKLKQLQEKTSTRQLQDKTATR